MSKELRKPFAWVARGMKDGEGDPIGDRLLWSKTEAEQLAKFYRNGLKRDQPGSISPLYLEVEEPKDCPVCDGWGSISTDIDEAPSTLCKACDGNGSLPK